MTSYQRRCDVITSHRRWYDVILMLCAWGEGTFISSQTTLLYMETSYNRVSDFRSFVCSLFPKVTFHIFIVIALSSSRLLSMPRYCFALWLWPFLGNGIYTYAFSASLICKFYWNNKQRSRRPAYYGDWSGSTLFAIFFILGTLNELSRVMGKRAANIQASNWLLRQKYTILFIYTVYI